MQDSDIIFLLRKMLIEHKDVLEEQTTIMLRTIVESLMQRQPYFCRYCAAGNSPNLEGWHQNPGHKKRARCAKLHQVRPMENPG